MFQPFVLGRQKQYLNLIQDDWSKFTPEEPNDKKMLSWNIDNFIKACGELHTNLKVISFNKSGLMS